MDKLSKIQRYKKLKENPELYIPKEFDRVDKDLETLNNNDTKLAESITILSNEKANKSSIEELYNDITEKISQVKTIKGDKGDSVKGDKGDNGDKGDKGDTVIVEKVIEKIEIIKETPIITENIVERITEDISGETIIKRINESEDKILAEKIEGIKSYDDEIATLQNRTQILAQITSGLSNDESNDEKVKLNSSDPTAGYLDDKITVYNYATKNEAIAYAIALG